MKIYDVSMMIDQDMQVYKNKKDKKPVIETVSDFSYASSHETKISMNLHTGTHLDFPLHMLPKGETSDALDLTKLIREVKVFDMTHLQDAITANDLIKKDIKQNDFILFKTRNSSEDFYNNDFIYIKEDASQYLASKKIVGVGVDGLGVERDQKDHPTHKILMNHDILIIEGLRLHNIKEGKYFMYALPIKIKHVDALPLSVILIEEPYENIPSNT